VPHLATLLAAVSPLDPTRDEARRWARHELSDPVYAQHEPGWAERALLWLWHSLNNLNLPAGPDGTSGLVILLALVLLAVLVVWLRAGPMRGPAARARQQAVLQGSVRTAAEHRAIADQAAAEGRWQDAVRERFRAVVRGLEERGLVDELPGRTAQEVAADAGRSLPAHRAQLREAAGVFDDVCYGSRTATAAHDAVVRRLDAQVAAATAVEGAPA
jgi:Domain of unknown function (DUF4129)